MKNCITGLEQFMTKRKARLACIKLTFQTRGVDRRIVAKDVCAHCGHFHITRMR